MTAPNNDTTRIVMSRPRYAQIRKSIGLARTAIAVVSQRVDERAHEGLARVATHLADVEAGLRDAVAREGLDKEKMMLPEKFKYVRGRTVEQDDVLRYFNHVDVAIKNLADLHADLVAVRRTYQAVDDAHPMDDFLRTVDYVCEWLRRAADGLEDAAYMLTLGITGKDLAKYFRDHERKEER